MTLCLASLMLVALAMRSEPDRGNPSDTLTEAGITERDDRQLTNEEHPAGAPDSRASATLSAARSAAATSAGAADAGAADAAAASTAPSAPARELPLCTVADDQAAAAGYGEWRTTLLDTRFRLDETYEPPDLVPTSAAFPPGSQAHGGGTLRALVIDDLRALVSDAAAAGFDLAIQSAYRSFAYQETTFQYWVDLQGYDHAIRTSARAGHSEHQLGTAVDLRSLRGPAAWDVDDWASTPEGAWVAENAWRYGFVMSYPSGKEHVTCYAYEPWHFRYVGRELAAAVNASGLAPREVMWRMLEEATAP